MTAAFVGSVYDNLVDKLIHDLRRKLSDMFILMYCLDKSSHIGGLLLRRINVGGQLGTSCTKFRVVRDDYEEKLTTEKK